MKEEKKGKTWDELLADLSDMVSKYLEKNKISWSIGTQLLFHLANSYTFTYMGIVKEESKKEIDELKKEIQELKEKRND